MADEAELEARPYERWEWDCPACGEVNDAGDIEPSGEETCSDCQATVLVRR